MTSAVTGTAPTITLNGLATSTISVGDLYLDLGARITGPTADTNLNITTLLDGATTTVVSALEREHGIDLVPKVTPAGERTHLARTFTGHLDFLQIRNGAVHILNYKPDARTNKPFAQLTIYALALTIRIPGLKLFDIKCAFFNGHVYNEFFPRTALRHPPHPFSERP